MHWPSSWRERAAIRATAIGAQAHHQQDECEGAKQEDVALDGSREKCWHTLECRGSGGEEVRDPAGGIAPERAEVTVIKRLEKIRCYLGPYAA